MKILITGNMGYIGPSVVQQLRSSYPDSTLAGLDTGYFAHCLTNSEILPECRIDQQYFNNQIEIRKIGWGLRKSRARLGHYDPVHHTVTLSPILDSPEVPGFVLHFIVYHELLHAVFECTSCHAIHKHHPPEFRRAERSHPDFANVKKFLREYCRKQ
jgi:hypothetical protein